MGNTNLKASDLDPDNFQGKSNPQRSANRLLARVHGLLGMQGQIASLIDRRMAFKLEAQTGYFEGNYCTFLTTR